MVSAKVKYHTFKPGDLVISPDYEVFFGNGMVLSVTKTGYVLPSSQTPCDEVDVLVNDQVIKTMTNYLLLLKP